MSRWMLAHGSRRAVDSRVGDTFGGGATRRCVALDDEDHCVARERPEADESTGTYAVVPTEPRDLQQLGDATALSGDTRTSRR